MPFKILIVDDNEKDLATARFILENESNFELNTTQSPLEAIKMVRATPNAFAVILLDYLMAEKSGDETARELLAINPHLIIAISSGDRSREALKKAIAAGVADFIDKDIDPEELKTKLHSFCKKFEETTQVFAQPSPNENAKLIQSIGMVGQSQALADVATLIHRAAPKDCNVLIHGESGTGKELAARAIHNLSPRRSKPFIAINVGAIPENLLESDLFGHERGAFTGADRQKIGKLKLADGGTVFLDEIGDMRLDLQVKLLRFLQEGEISPVGALTPSKVNVRVVAASHVNLEEAVNSGKFREDLFYRLNVVKIDLPALRERPEDIQPLVAHFQHQFGGDSKTILMKTIRYFESYPWKGNIRELENEMEKLMTIVPTSKIEPQHLSSKFFSEQSMPKTHDFDCSYGELMDRLEEVERKYIAHHLAKSRSAREASARMKAPHGTIYGRMRKLSIEGGEKYEAVNV